MKKSDFGVDLELSFFDRRRIFAEDVETMIYEGMVVVLLKKLARISRGVFQPTNMREKKWVQWHGKAPQDDGIHFKIP